MNEAKDATNFKPFSLVMLDRKNREINNKIGKSETIPSIAK